MTLLLEYMRVAAVYLLSWLPDSFKHFWDTSEYTIKDKQTTAHACLNKCLLIFAIY
jgi:hypothetical protein